MRDIRIGIAGVVWGRLAACAAVGYRRCLARARQLASSRRTPGVCGGKACIAGHRVRVLDVVVWHEHQGMTPDEIVSHFPTITLAEVHAALAYYFDHLEEIQQEMQAERAFADEFRRNNPSLLETKLRQERLEEAS